MLAGDNLLQGAGDHAGGTGLHAVSIYVVATIMPVVVGEIGRAQFLRVDGDAVCGGVTGEQLRRCRCCCRGLGPAAGVLGWRACLFAMGSLTCSLAASMPVLLAGRLVQGLGGGMLPALGYGLIRRIFPPASACAGDRVDRVGVGHRGVGGAGDRAGCSRSTRRGGRRSGWMC
jgi:MFS family permease